MTLSNSINNEVEPEDDKIDWDELVGNSQKYIEISKFEFGPIIILLLFIYLVIHASIWGMWGDGIQ